MPLFRLRSFALLFTLGGVLVLGPSACTDAERDATSSDDIIGGVAIRGARLDAIGSLGESVAPEVASSDGGAEAPSFFNFCTATLVAPRLVLTAKHCVRRRTKSEFFFNVGGDGKRPLRSARVTSVSMATLGEGGFAKLGADVALLGLEAPLDGVEPLRVLDSALPPAAVGARLSAVGFGYRDRARSSGSRLLGTLTLQHVQGPLFGTFASAEELKAFAQQEAPDVYDDDGDGARFEEAFGKTILTDYEAFLGLGEGDSQPCSGDSGGPLIARMGNDLVVAAVVSGSLKYSNIDAQPCSVLGEVYATFGANVQQMFDEVSAREGQPLNRVSYSPIHRGSAAVLPPSPETTPLDDGGTAPGDRCRGLSATGVCNDTTVNRCIAEAEGPARAVRVDCSLLLATCTETSGVAECAQD